MMMSIANSRRIVISTQLIVTYGTSILLFEGDRSEGVMSIDTCGPFFISPID